MLFASGTGGPFSGSTYSISPVVSSRLVGNAFCNSFLMTVSDPVIPISLLTLVSSRLSVVVPYKNDRCLRTSFMHGFEESDMYHVSDVILWYTSSDEGARHDINLDCLVSAAPFYKAI